MGSPCPDSAMRAASCTPRRRTAAAPAPRQSRRNKQRGRTTIRERSQLVSWAHNTSAMPTRRDVLALLAAAAVPLPRVAQLQRRGPSQRVIVIGGGLGGLCAAFELQNLGYS